MRICILAPVYHPHPRGGLESYVLELVRRLHERGHEVCVVSRGETTGRVPDAGPVEVYTIRRVDFQNFLWGTPRRSRGWFIMHSSEIFSSYSARMARRFIAKWQPEILFSQSFFGFGRGMPKMLEETGLPWLHSVHSYDLVCKRQTAMDAAGHVCATPCRDCRAICRYKYGPQPLRRAITIYNSEHMRRFFENAGLRTAGSHVVDPVFDYRGAELDPAYRPAAPVRLFYVGRVAPEKGVHLLCEAVAGAPDEFQLDVLGEGPLLAELREKYDRLPNLVFHGHVPPDGRDRLLRFAHALVVPSLWNEPFGRVVQEGFLAGLPVLAADVGSMAGMVRHGVDGFVFPWQEGRELANLTDALHAMAPLLPRLRGGALETRARLMEQDNCSRIEGLLQQALRPEPPAETLEAAGELRA